MALNKINDENNLACLKAMCSQCILIEVIQAQKRLLAKTKCSKSPPSTKKKKKSSAVSKVKGDSRSKVKFVVPNDESKLGINNILPRAA